MIALLHSRACGHTFQQVYHPVCSSYRLHDVERIGANSCTSGTAIGIPHQHPLSVRMPLSECRNQRRLVVSLILLGLWSDSGVC